ncbi:hypothetical protein H5410_028206 [Solanum commersonii]|uniref:Uncharacterized protein n=1 Tax=Solanum commersonii TaxID=4109 RepID=A0A9J5Z209_SOLCO|nr:hypothetical protein H5410_028206 [Solanum commersonii]
MHLRTLILSNIALNESNLWNHHHPELKLLLVLKQTQVQPFKKGISNNATQDSIINVHNKTQFTYAKIKCALKDSSCDSLISKNLMLTILASNASSSSTKVCPYFPINICLSSLKIKKVVSRLVMGLSAKSRIHVRSIRSTIQVIGIDRNRDSNFAKEQPLSTHERWQKLSNRTSQNHFAI